MTAHIAHPDLHTFGLVQGCPRCDQEAVHPDQLDAEVRDRLLHGRLYTELDRQAARWLRASIPHAFRWEDLAPSLCGLCAQLHDHPIHQEAV